MQLLPDIDLTKIAPIVALAAIAAICIIALLLRSVLHSRIALLIAVVIGIVIAGPTLSGAFAAIFNSLAIVIIVCAGASVAALVIVRSNPDLLDLVRDALARIPRQSSLNTPATPVPGQTAITVIDQPQQIQRRRSTPTGNNAGSDWGF